LRHVSIKNRWLSLKVLDYGAIIQKLQFRTAPDTWMDLVVGHEDPRAYLQDPFAMGACVGRFAGRLSGGSLDLEGKSFPLSHREGITLHGGDSGFAKRYWTIEAVAEGADQPEIRLSYFSPHLEEGFPGNLRVTVRYQLQENALAIKHEAVTDRPTVVNLTNHSYFKIDRQPLISHYGLHLQCSRRLETDARLLPTGRLLDVEGTPFDFRKEKSLDGIALDTPFVVDPGANPAAALYSPISGVRMRVHTDQPALVLFNPAGMPSLCFEAQNFPDAPRFSHFPSAVLRPGETYRNESRFVFEKGQ
jgi:aldose 1-epimerase